MSIALPAGRWSWLGDGLSTIRLMSRVRSRSRRTRSPAPRFPQSIRGCGQVEAQSRRALAPCGFERLALALELEPAFLGRRQLPLRRGQARRLGLVAGAVTAVERGICQRLFQSGDIAMQ